MCKQLKSHLELLLSRAAYFLSVKWMAPIPGQNWLSKAVEGVWKKVGFLSWNNQVPSPFCWTYRLRSQPCITHQHCREVDRCLQEQLRRHPSHLSTRVYLLSEVWISINPKRGFDDVPFTSTRTKLEVLNMGLSWSIPEPFESCRLRTFKSLNWAGKTSQTSL